MPRLAQVFVSHSSQDGDLSAALCELLRAPRADGVPICDVLVDDIDLVPGKEWPKQIHEFMAKCHAAVILLTENAVRSDWVLKEARSHTDRARFKSVPAPVADLPHPPDPPQPARNVLRVISAFVTDVSDQMTQMIKFTC